eukprot:TRINITY_DN21916_c0_g1_i3.p1 TRINITY_DN21916_c0_g1~~TRINITY_DN21916_c0_g1_i3.p1  ORF type:complete len:122 (-),score=26.73 TRINITY_DN21916_c0_g1_i3:339-704(-)
MPKEEPPVIHDPTKPSVQCCRFGVPPDPSIPQQQFPGVETAFLPHDALIVYTDKLMAERRAWQSTASKYWFREHKAKKREEAKILDMFRDHRERQRQVGEEARTLSRTKSMPSYVSLPRLV